MRALLFTDIVDSTRATETLGETGAAQFWAEHDCRARDLLALHRGLEIDRSDGFFLLFDGVVAAAAFAQDYHKAMASLGVAARVGLHRAEVQLRANAPEHVARGAKPLEVDSLAKPLAARIMGLARGGQTLLSASAREALAATLADGQRLEAHGPYRFKGLQEPVEVFELGEAGDAFVPPPDSDKAYRVVHDDGLWRPLREVRHNLAPERDRFVGRGIELAALARRLDDGARLLTLLGPAGTGKTRLVRRYCRAWLGDWPGGAYFCDLSEARTLDGIFFAVSLALEVPLAKGEPAEQLGHVIAARGRCLVVLDNFEQVAEHATASLARWLDRTTEGAFVATSRVRLNVPGEEAVPVEPLAHGGEAVELFVARAQSREPRFALNAENRAAVSEIVRLLDGMPLAIELAAARISVLAPAQIVERLTDRFRLLVGGSGVAARQATLRAAIDWSWNLLMPWEQAALAQCSVFEGGFTLEAAEAVLDLSARADAVTVIDTVQSLVDKSLLRTMQGGDERRYGIGEPYFGMFLSIHEYAVERFRAAPGQLAAHRRHARHYGTFGHSAALHALRSSGGARQRRALMQDLDNLVCACKRSLAQAWLDSAVACFRAAAEAFGRQGPFSTGTELGAQVLALPGLPAAEQATVVDALASLMQRAGRTHDALALAEQCLAAFGPCDKTLERGHLHATLATLHRLCGEPAKSRAHIDAGLGLARHLGERPLEARLFATLAQWHNNQGEAAASLSRCYDALAIEREMHDLAYEASLLNQVGVVHAEAGRLDEAKRAFERAMSINLELDDRVSLGTVLTNLGCLHHEQGNFGDAVRRFDEALAIHRDVGNRRFEGYVLGDMGRLHMQRGDFAESRRCLEASLAVTRESGDKRIEGSELRSLADLHLARGRLDEAGATIDAAEAVLRAVGDKFYLGFVMCGRAEWAYRSGDAALAQQALAEAEALAAAVAVGEGSELRVRIGTTRTLIGIA